MSPSLSGLIEIALRAGAVLAIAAVVAFALRRRSAELRHAVWLASLIGITALPVVTASVPTWPVPILPGDTTVVTSNASWAEGATSLQTSTPSAPASPRRPPMGDVVFAIWLLGAALFAVRAFRSHLQLGRLLRRSRPLDRDSLAFDLRALAAAIGVAVPECRWSEAIDVPLAAGSFRPILLLPDKAREWSRDRRRAVLLHELSHLRRRDPLWLVLAQVAGALYWFHPLVWLAVRQLRAESERACDDAVLRAGERASGYAEDLLAVALEHTTPAPAAGVAFLRSNGLESRIDAILARRRDRARLGPTQTLMVATAAFLVSLSLAVAQPVPAASGQKEATPAPEAVSPDALPREAWLSRATRTTPSFVGYQNPPDAPVLILQAQARIVDLEGGRAGLTMPALRLANRDRNRRVRELRLGLDLPTTRDRITESVNIAAGEEAQLRVLSRQWSSVVPAEEAKRLQLHIVAVEFSDGSTWIGEDPEPPWPPSPKATAGETPKPSQPIAPRPAPEQRAKAAADGPTLAARYRNPAGAPVVIVEALTPLTPGIDEGRPYTWLPRVRVENHSARRVVALRVRYKPDRESHAVSGFDIAIEPHGTATLNKDAYAVWGRAEDMKVQLLGVQFADGSIWGTLDSSIDARDTWVYPLEGSEAR